MIEHAINKRLTLDITRQAKMNARYIANDATSYYDRILLMVAYLTMRNCRIPQHAAQSSIETIFEMETLSRQLTETRKTVTAGHNGKADLMRLDKETDMHQLFGLE